MPSFSLASGYFLVLAMVLFCGAGKFHGARNVGKC